MFHNNLVIVSSAEMRLVFTSILLRYGFSQNKAGLCAEIFTANSVDGIYTHGVNRFSKFIEYVKNGYIITDAEPTLQHKFGGLEQWNGNLGPGPLNALQATDRATHLATENGIG